MIGRAVLCAVVLVITASTALAQQKERIGLVVGDVRISSAGLPSEPGWIPAVPTATVAPTRGFGLDLGAHFHVLRFRSMALGVGASWLRAQSTSTPPEPTTTPTTPSLIPEVTTKITSFAPQLSLNFGHAMGWSYVSAGLGRARVESDATLAGTTFTPRNSDWVKTLNYGGGARWFLRDHIGVGFDIRWHKLSLVAATATTPAAPRASSIVIGAGVVVK